MLRFAPSPTADMSLGDLRIALYSYIVARQKNEDFIVRIEDIDKDKNIEGKDKEILDLLALFGVNYSQTIYQSENVRFHTAMALQLMHEKKAFSCFCSDAWLQKKRDEAKEANKTYQYDDACRNLPAELVIDNENPFTIRIKRPDGEIVVKDYVEGELSFDAKSIDSFVIMNQDKTPTADFATAVDDMLSDISLIVRDEKLLESTPKQEHVRMSLSYNKKIEYAHLPSIDFDKAPSVKELLENGILPEAISNYLVSLGNKMPKEIFSFDEALEDFSLKNIQKSPTSFDINKLLHINKEHLKNLDNKELSRYVGFADEEIGALAKLYLDDVSTTKELKSKIKPIFNEKNIDDNFKNEAEILTNSIKKAPFFDKYDEFQKYMLSETNMNDEKFSKTLRLLLTGSADGPDIAKVYKYLKNYIGEIVK
jgi:glutamyl-tRNA synthetase